MIGKRAIFLLAFSGGFLLAGCASAPRHPLANHWDEKTRAKPESQASGDDSDHADLERELSLYSD